jgi:hypothetical protein
MFGIKLFFSWVRNELFFVVLNAKIVNDVVDWLVIGIRFGFFIDFLTEVWN